MDEFDRPGSRDRSPSPLALPRRGGKLSEHDVTLSGRVALRCSAYDERERERESSPGSGSEKRFLCCPASNNGRFLHRPWSPYIINYCINLTGRKQSIIHGIRATTDIAAPLPRLPLRALSATL